MLGVLVLGVVASRKQRGRRVSERPSMKSRRSSSGMRREFSFSLTLFRYRSLTFFLYP